MIPVQKFRRDTTARNDMNKAHMFTLLTTHALNAHLVWLRLTAQGRNMFRPYEADVEKEDAHAAEVQDNTTVIQLADYLDLTTGTCHLSGIVLRQHNDPWRMDVLCYRAQGDCVSASFKGLLPEHTPIQAKTIAWPTPTLMKPTIMLANDTDGLAAVSRLYAWRQRLPSSLLLWQTQGELPFALGPSQIYTPELPPDMIATMLEFETLGVVLRILSDTERPGCFHGDVSALFKLYPDLSTWQTLPTAAS